MSTKFKILSTLVFCSLITLFQCGNRQFITIATGSLTGVYYPTGNAIAKMVNQNKANKSVKVTVETSAGSVFNVNALINKQVDFGVVQSDRQYQAYNNLAEWKADKVEQEAKNKTLRSVFSIHYETLTLVAAKDSQIKTLNDIRGKKVNIGSPGSGQRQNSIDALSFFNIDYQKDIITENVKASDSPGLLQDKRIDAFFYTVGHPNGTLKEVMAGKRTVSFVDVLVSDDFINDYPYYSKTVIAKEIYELEKDVQTFGVKATLCTRADVNQEIVYLLVKSVFENFENFKTLHPSYQYLTKEDMLNGLSAPLHSGAKKYYQEVGLLQD